MLKKSYFFIFALLFIFTGLSSCISLRAAFHKDLTMEQRYYLANKDFNDNLQDYLAIYRMADSETKEKWKAEIDPIFKRGKQALDVWGLGIGTTNAIEAEGIWMSIKNNLLAALFEYGVLMIE